MTWAALIPIIVNYGLPLAEKLWQLSTSSAEPTQAGWDELKAMASQTPLSQMRDALSRSGKNPDAPEFAALLALVK